MSRVFAHAHTPSLFWTNICPTHFCFFNRRDCYRERIDQVLVKTDHVTHPTRHRNTVFFSSAAAKRCCKFLARLVTAAVCDAVLCCRQTEKEQKKKRSAADQCCSILFTQNSRIRLRPHVLCPYNGSRIMLFFLVALLFFFLLQFDSR